MKSKRRTRSEIDADIVAYLLSTGKEPADIMRDLDWNDPRMSRAKSLAAKEGKYKIILSDDVRERLDEIQREVALRYCPEGQELKERLNDGAKRPIRRLYVVGSSQGAGSKDVNEWDEAASQFGREAAPVVYRILLNATLCGTGWGRTLRSLVRALDGLSLPTPWKGSRIRYFPVWGVVPGCGEEEECSDYFSDPSELASTRLAKDLSVITNGSVAGVPSLEASPAILPPRFAKIKAVREFAFHNSDYQEVFGTLGGKGTKVGLVAQMNSFLAAAGSFDYPGRALSNAVMAYAETTQETLRKMAYGDIGGVMIPRPGYRKNAEFQDICNRWMGIRMEHLERLAEAALNSKGKSPGSIVCAVGHSRCDVVKEATQLGLVTELIIDKNLADALRSEFRLY